MTIVTGLRIAIAVELVLLAVYWAIFLKDHLSVATAGKVLGRSWHRVWTRVPKYVSIPYIVLILIGSIYFVAFFAIDSGSYSGPIGLSILAFLPVVLYLVLAPLKGRVDSLLLRRRLRSLKSETPRPDQISVFRSKAMIAWYAGFGLIFLILWYKSLGADDVRGSVFLVAAIFGFYWLTVSFAMPDFKVTSGTIQIRKKKLEVIPYYVSYSSSDHQFLLDGSNMKIRRDGKDLESVRIDKMKDSDLIQVNAFMRSRT